MNKDAILISGLALGIVTSATALADSSTDAASVAPKVPAFSINYMDRSVDPGTDFYHYADGTWLKDNPVPPDKSRWASFSELAERNWYLIHGILDDATANSASLPEHAPKREVGDFFASVMNTNLIEELGTRPIADDLKKIDEIQSITNLFAVLADFHQHGIGGMFDIGFGPDDKKSTIYAVELGQAGLSLPDRDYYLKDTFADKLKKYREHVTNMLTLLGEKPDVAAAHADIVIALETELAKASRSRVELRDPDKNYNKFLVGDFAAQTPAFAWNVYFADRDIKVPSYEIVGQPEFFTALNGMIRQHSLNDWKVYLRWHLLHSSAPFLSSAFENENFNFYGKVLSGQPEQEPRWKRGAHILDGTIGEALGQLYVEKYFPPEARKRMNDLVENEKQVFHDRLEKVSWMTAATRAKALAKFTRFTQKIGYPAKFRDYSSVEIRRDDLLGNVRRAEAFASHRQIVRIGKRVDRTEWGMTPETVNAYFNPLQNEIVFPAGILQPPFYDPNADDAVNYGAMGAVIGHEMSHGFDDQGRRFDARGNLRDWWTKSDADKYNAQAQRVVDQFNAYTIVDSTTHVNGKLTLGENIGDLGGLKIAYLALEKSLKEHGRPAKIDGFTPEQRFFLGWAQVWRTLQSDAAAKAQVNTNPHAPAKWRVNGPLSNMPEFKAAWGCKDGDPMVRPDSLRARIW